MSSRIILWSGVWFVCMIGLPLLAAPPEANSKTSASAIARASLGDAQSVYVGKARGWTLHGANRLRSWQRGLLTRELCRQALLLAAREEAGLATQDAWLDEPVPTRGSAALDIVASGGASTRVEVLEGLDPVQSLLWGYELKATSEPLDYLKLLQELESLSRGTLQDLLKPQRSQDGKRIAPATVNAASAHLSPAIEKLLGEMSVVAQFHAVHDLHAMIGKQGESPALLGGLVRGYANLGLLTEPLWHPMHQVFKARALLYAQRMVTRDPDAKLPLWHRAYALALTGLHGLALADAKTASQDTDDQPVWGEVVRAFCRYNTVALGEIKRSQAEYELAHLLRYVCAEQSHIHSRTARVAAEEFEKLPNCTRITNGLQNIRNTMATNIPQQPVGTVGRSFYSQLAAIPDLPERVATLLPARRAKDPTAQTTEEFTLRAKIIAALRGAVPPGAGDAKTAAVDELPWRVLGRMILEESFLEFLPGNENSEYDNAGSDGRRAEIEIVLADHPYRPFALGYAWGGMRDRALLEQLTKVVEIDAVEMKEFSLLRAVGDFDLAYYDLRRMAAADHEDMITGDIVSTSDWWPKSTYVARCRELLEISPYSPFARATVLEQDWKNAQKVAEAWEAAAPEHPGVLLALGKQYLNAKEFDKAERCLKPVSTLDPSLKSQALLAEVYKQQGDTDRWIVTLAEAARGPAGDVDAAKIPLMIADYFVTRREWDKARPYADAAGEGGTIEGMMLASTVYEALQDWEHSEKWIKQAASADVTRPFEWYFWCKRTGQGDQVEALRLAQSYIDQRDELKITRSEPALFQSSIPGTFYLLKGDLDAARRHFEEGYLRTPNPDTGLHAMLIAEAQNNTARRDLLLKEIETKTSASDRRTRAALVALAQLFAKDLSQGGKAALDWDAVNKLAASAPPADRVNIYYFLGVYLDQKGNSEKAIEYWKRCMGFLPANIFSRTLAGSALWDRAVQPFEYKAALQPPAKAEAKQ